jgi:membrane fusion protein (multidrug efflux system)
VKAGDRIVEFDNTTVLEKLLELELAVIEAAIELDTARAESAVAIAEKQFEVDTQKTMVAKAQLDAEVPEQLVSRRDFQNFRVALERARAALATAQGDLKANVGGGRLDEQVKEIAYQKAMRSYTVAGGQLDALSLTAPRDGVVVIGEHPWEGRKLQVGDNAWPGLTVAKLPDLSRMIVEASLSDVDDGRILPGMRVTCVVDAYPDAPLQGVIRAVSPVAQEVAQQGRQMSTRRFFAVVIDLEDASASILRPGLSVKVEVVTRTSEDALVAPRAGLDLAAEPPVARLWGGGEVEVEVDFCDAVGCAITAGLSEGDRLRRSGVSG